MGDIGETLWNPDVGPDAYANDTRGAYQSAIFEQYKLCVEMADRVSARRNQANTFFLTLHSGLAAFLSAWLTKGPQSAPRSAWVLSAGLIVLITLCAAWWFTVRSYRQLNQGKFAVIGALEERLPAGAFWKAEWQALRQGTDWRVYLPLNHVERWVPGIFAGAYLLGYLALVL
ncbi:MULTISPECIES: hypothetical protein [unclassified Streptomyces]|uniref:RipA family octameric membrane protein n=1 Tax=unclassified Streptomyces TaxID=2593676 RepID=UPI00278C7103|nr:MULTISPECIES: hypothetical protein [unclassified Streptomyces]